VASFSEGLQGLAQDPVFQDMWTTGPVADEIASLERLLHSEAIQDVNELIRVRSTLAGMRRVKEIVEKTAEPMAEPQQQQPVRRPVRTGFLSRFLPRQVGV
jgi:hypothetical protein